MDDMTQTTTTQPPYQVTDPATGEVAEHGQREVAVVGPAVAQHE